MNCSNFIFDGESLSDYGMIICNWNAGSNTSWSGGDVTFTTGKTPGSDRQSFYTSSYENPLSCTLSICKNPCGYTDRKEVVITREEYSALSRWLKRSDGYHPLQFEQDNYEDICFYAQIDMQPYLVCGSIVGFDLTVNTDSPYGWSPLVRKEFDLTSGNPNYSFIDYSDKTGCLYPTVTITPSLDGSIILQSGIPGNLKVTTIKNCKENQKIVLDGSHDYYSGINSPNDFSSFIFPVIANDFHNRNNTFSLVEGSVDMHIKLEYRQIRWVVV